MTLLSLPFLVVALLIPKSRFFGSPLVRDALILFCAGALILSLLDLMVIIRLMQSGQQARATVSHVYLSRRRLRDDIRVTLGAGGKREYDTLNHYPFFIKAPREGQTVTVRWHPDAAFALIVDRPASRYAIPVVELLSFGLILAYLLMSVF